MIGRLLSMSAAVLVVAGMTALPVFAQDKMSGDKMSGDKMSGDKMAGDKMAGDKMAGDKMAGDKMAGDKMAGDKMAGDKMAGDKMAGDKMHGDKMHGGKSHGALDAKRRPAMSYSTSTLLIRNLYDVFGENDPVRRRAAIDEIYTEDCVFYEPGGGVYHGRDEIDRIAGALRATHPDFRYQPIAEPEELGDGGRVRWLEGSPGEAPAVAGTDFIIARDGRIAAVYLFFDKLP